jgi:S-adenosylmethionine hydrolase
MLPDRSLQGEGREHMGTFSRNYDGAPSDSPIITLLSDFGSSDQYVASMKGVILSICGRALLVDITHEVPKFNIGEAAYLLAATTLYFPSGTIHLCVVDPGVGTSRKALLVKTKRSFLVGPDNGVLMLAADKEGIEKVIEIKNRKYMLETVSSTFQGRDIFAAAAAHLANGVGIDEFGPQTVEYQMPVFSKASISGGKLQGEIIHIDDFGNIITNIMSSDLAKLNIAPGAKTRISISRRTIETMFCNTYGEVKEGEYLMLIGSSGFLEISIRQGDAATSCKAKEGIGITLSNV